jgi:hypothetical protein
MRSLVASTCASSPNNEHVNTVPGSAQVDLVRVDAAVAFQQIGKLTRSPVTKVWPDQKLTHAFLFEVRVEGGQQVGLGLTAEASQALPQASLPGGTNLAHAFF